MTLQAQYFGSIFDFVDTETAELCDQLCGSREDWQYKIALLKQQLKQLPHLAGDVLLGLSSKDCQLTVEALILYRGLVFPLNIDLTGDNYPQEKTNAVMHQARLIKNNHAESQSKFIVPLHIATLASPQGGAITVSEDLVADTMCDNGEHLAALIEHFSNQYKDDQIILSDWLNSDYRTD